MTAGEKMTPEDDGTVGAAVDALARNGKWTTDCGCMTAIDRTMWRTKRFGGGMSGFLVVLNDGTTEGHHGPQQTDPTEAVVQALDHKCDTAYQPVATTPA